MAQKIKIINDPIYGFITIDHPVVNQLVSHPYYQRLRRIHQMALASLVYPGAVHTRLHHSLGAYHLMGLALEELKRKGTPLTADEELGAKLAILLHDIGHGPYSHALESLLIKGVSHETIGLAIMQKLNQEMDGALDTAIAIFCDKYPKRYLHQLVSGQLDVDRMDYLTRDSFYTGVSEGVIGYDRIIKMLTVHNGQLMVEEKAVYSIEKFLVARRLMYWQVYLHKTVLSAEQMLVKIMQRARQVDAPCHPNLRYFIQLHQPTTNHELLERFTALDDVDVMMAIKEWQFSTDKPLALLCQGIINRRLLKLRLQQEPFAEHIIQEKREALRQQYGLNEEELDFLVFTGLATNTTYKINDERIQICFKNGAVKEISQVDNALIQQSLAATVAKHYICWLQ